MLSMIPNDIINRHKNLKDSLSPTGEILQAVR